MVIGRVKWFGGLNKKFNELNDYGYLHVLEGEVTEDVKIYRQDISQELQSIIEGRDGEGVYVQFEIEQNGTRKRGINVELITFIGIVDWFDTNLRKGYIKCEGRSDVRLISYNNHFTYNKALDSGLLLFLNKHFTKNEILQFGLRYNSRFNEDEAIFIKKIDFSTKNLNIIQKFLQSSSPEIADKVIINYAQIIPTNEAITFILEKFKSFNLPDKQTLINEISCTAPDILIHSSELRSLLMLDELRYARFIDLHINRCDDNLKTELIEELKQNINKAYNNKKYLFDIYFENIKGFREIIEYQGLYWYFAPVEYKKQLIQKRFQEFFEIVAQFNNSDYPYSQAITGDWRELYKFDAIDRAIIKEWDASVSDNAFNAAKMISARGAEKLVIQFCQTLGYEVEDVSSHQVTGQSEEWIKGDIKLKNTLLLDVKNARKSLNYDVYSEFCIPKFKKIQRSNCSINIDVKIVAVFSPYLNKEEIDQIKSSYLSYDKQIIVLGACTQTQLQRLAELFNDSNIQIDTSRNCDPKFYLPHWLFDYGENFYIKQLKAIEKFNQLTDDDIPSWEDIFIVDRNVFPLFLIFITAKRKLPQGWIKNLHNWQVNFINSLIELPVKRITLPYLFLSLLKHFLNMLSYQGLYYIPQDYSPQKYLKLLYPNSLNERPLKIYDPLNTIKDFCETLQKLWEYRKQANLDKFRIFRFNGRGWLQGKRPTDTSYKTLITYCGGEVTINKGKFACGYAPLVIGQHNLCLECGHLICPKENCLCCSRNCSSYFQRKQEKQAREKQDNFLDINF